MRIKEIGGQDIYKSLTKMSVKVLHVANDIFNHVITKIVCLPVLQLRLALLWVHAHPDAKIN